MYVLTKLTLNETEFITECDKFVGFLSDWLCVLKPIHPACKCRPSADSQKNHPEMDSAYGIKALEASNCPVMLTEMTERVCVQQRSPPLSLSDV